MERAMIDGIYIPGDKWEPTMSTKEAMKCLGVDRKTLYAWRKKGLPCHQPNGGKCYFFRSEIEAWLRSSSKPPVLTRGDTSPAPRVTFIKGERR